MDLYYLLAKKLMLFVCLYKITDLWVLYVQLYNSVRVHNTVLTFVVYLRESINCVIVQTWVNKVACP